MVKLYFSNYFFIDKVVFFIHTKRINAILKSSKDIEVHYNNNPVWIQTVDEKNSTARVKVLGSNEVLVVPLVKLNEV